MLLTHGDMALGFVRSIVDGGNVPDVEVPEGLNGMFVAVHIVGTNLYMPSQSRRY